MNIEELSQLEHKVNHVVSRIKTLREENVQLKKELASLRKETDTNTEERDKVREKVNQLISLIDSIENP